MVWSAGFQRTVLLIELNVTGQDAGRSRRRSSHRWNVDLQQYAVGRIKIYLAAAANLCSSWSAGFAGRQLEQSPQSPSPSPLEIGDAQGVARRITHAFPDPANARTAWPGLPWRTNSRPRGGVSPQFFRAGAVQRLPSSRFDDRLLLRDLTNTSLTDGGQSGQRMLNTMNRKFYIVFTAVESP